MLIKIFSMKQFPFYLVISFLIVTIQFGCQPDEDLIPWEENSLCDSNSFQENDLLQSVPETELYGQFSLVFFDQNPLEFTSARPTGSTFEFWENKDAYQIGSGGSGNCGEGYEYITSPYMSIGLLLSEFDNSSENAHQYKRFLNIQVPFPCDSFSTQEKFYDLLKEESYDFGNSWEDFSDFIIEYKVEGKSYSSLGVDNSIFSISVSDLKNKKPIFNTEPNGNNGNPASVEATFKFCALLKSEDGKYLLIQNAQIRGRYFRMAPWGYYWEDWGKGWDQN